MLRWLEEGREKTGLTKKQEREALLQVTRLQQQQARRCGKERHAKVSDRPKRLQRGM